MFTSTVRRIQYVVAFGMMTAFLAPIAGQAQSLDINYYTISSSDPDADHLAGGLFTNEVQNALGSNNLPVLNIPQFGCTSDCYPVSGAPGFPSGGSTPNANVNAPPVRSPTGVRRRIRTSPNTRNDHHAPVQRAFKFLPAERHGLERRWQ
jgi:hypothetical protein